MNKIYKVRLHCCSHETSCSSEVMTLERLEQKKQQQKKTVQAEQCAHSPATGLMTQVTISTDRVWFGEIADSQVSAEGLRPYSGCSDVMGVDGVSPFPP